MLTVTLLGLCGACAAATILVAWAALDVAFGRSPDEVRDAIAADSASPFPCSPEAAE